MNFFSMISISVLDILYIILRTIYWVSLHWFESIYHNNMLPSLFYVYSFHSSHFKKEVQRRVRKMGVWVVRLQIRSRFYTSQVQIRCDYYFKYCYLLTISHVFIQTCIFHSFHSPIPLLLPLRLLSTNCITTTIILTIDPYIF